VDLLENEVRIPALFRRGLVPVDPRGGAGHDSADIVVDDGPLAVDRDQLPLAKADHVSRAVEQRGDVGRQVVAVGPEANHQRRMATGSHEYLGLVQTEDDDRVGSLHAIESLADGQAEPGRKFAVAVPVQALELVLDQVSQHLGVGLGGEPVPALGELGAQDREILDDSVVDHADTPVTIGVRVRVFVRRSPVSGPARVADAKLAFDLATIEHAHQIGQLARGAVDAQLAIRRDDGYAGRVVPAVLQAPQPVDQELHGRATTRVADYAAHVASSSSPAVWATRTSPGSLACRSDSDQSSSVRAPAASNIARGRTIRSAALC